MSTFDTVEKTAFRPRLQKKRVKPIALGMPITHVILIALGFFYLYPFLWMVSGALKSSGGFFSQGLSLIPDSWHWENFYRAWTEANFGTYFVNTLIITITVIALTVLFTSMAGYAIARLRIVGKRVFLVIIAATFILPAGYTLIPVFDIILHLGLNDTLLAVIVVNTAGGMIFNTFLFAGYFTTQSREIDEAAIVDGAGVFRRYWNISLPLAGPMIATISLFSFIGNWNSFLIPLIFTLGNPDLRTLAVGMYAFVGQNSQEWTLTCAGATITLIPIIILFFFLQKYFVEGVAGAVK